MTTSTDDAGPRDMNAGDMDAGDPGPGTPAGTAERPATFFRDAAEWRSWLEQHHDTSPGIWIELRRRHVADRGLQWAEAVREALRFGWIDSQVQRLHDDAVRQRWTPRRPGSIWSAVNVATARELVAQGLMQPAGLAAFEARRTDREAVYAYEQSDDTEAWTPDHDAALAAVPGALAFWDAAPPGYRKLCRHWVTSAKQEATRHRRLAQLVQCCAGGELVPSQRWGTPPAWLARARAASGQAADRPAGVSCCGSPGSPDQP